MVEQTDVRSFGRAPPRPAKVAPRRDTGFATRKAEPAPAADSDRPKAGSEIAAAFASCRAALIGVVLFSAMANILMLTGAIFMLEVYDRVLPSRSVPTLVGIAILAAILFLALGVVDLIRGRIMVRIGGVLDERVGPRVFNAMARIPLVLGQQGEGLQPQRDLDSIRSFLSGPGPNAFFDLPWLPFYIAVIWIFHPLLGITALVGAIILVAMTLATEFMTRDPSSTATKSGMVRNSLAEASRRNAEVVTAMGMADRLRDQWQKVTANHLADQQRVSDVAGGFGSFSKVFRMALQSAVLGAGAWLVIHDQATAGIIIAGAILAGRALAPVDLAISQWKGFVAARQSWKRLKTLLAALPEPELPMKLPPPSAAVSVTGLAVCPPGVQRLLVQDVNFSLEAGQCLGIIGPSASGKSSLVRSLVGAWRPAAGRIRIDGAALDQWRPEDLGRHVGYLPQDVELFAGTVAQNIARFEPDPDPMAITAAATAAGVHSLILALANGYHTQIGDGGQALSGGQRQRIALARALYGNPFLVVLDEPSSSLDRDGELALTSAVRAVKDRRGIVIIVAHRPTSITEADLVLFMSQGRPQAFGPKEAVLAKMMGKPQVAAHVNGNQTPKRGRTTGDDDRNPVMALETVLAKAFGKPQVEGPTTPGSGEVDVDERKQRA